MMTEGLRDFVGGGDTQRLPWQREPEDASALEGGDGSEHGHHGGLPGEARVRWQAIAHPCARTARRTRIHRVVLAVQLGPP